MPPAVRLTRVGDRSVGQVAADLDLTETAMREWAKRADADEGKGAPETLTTDEPAGDALPARRPRWAP
jgi:transposase